MNKFFVPHNQRLEGEDTFIHRLVLHGFNKCVKYLIQKGIMPKLRTSNEYLLYPYCTLLHIAVGAENYLLSELLIKNGAKIDSKDGNESTPLHYACQKGNI